MKPEIIFATDRALLKEAVRIADGARKRYRLSENAHDLVLGAFIAGYQFARTKARVKVSRPDRGSKNVG